MPTDGGLPNRLKDPLTKRMIIEVLPTALSPTIMTLKLTLALTLYDTEDLFFSIRISYLVILMYCNYKDKLIRTHH